VTIRTAEQSTGADCLQPTLRYGFRAQLRRSVGRPAMNIGLKYGTVEIVPHHTGWQGAYAREHAKLDSALSGMGCRIEHVGSTAVPELPAKPIIDIAVGLSPESSLESVITILKAMGYIYRGDAGSSGGHIFVRESAPLVRTHHIHVVFTGDPQWEEYLLFRDLLRKNPKIRETYAAEKLALAERYPMDRRSYTNGKDRLVRRLLDQGRPTSG
jgi:GrpB-like predicted nucleotidyltransferase (UPF0157 family)